MDQDKRKSTNLEKWVDVLDWKKGHDLLPAVVQDHESGKVLMLGYMNKESFRITLTSKKITFYSRQRQKIWQKGETSGHYLHLKSWAMDCDKDSLLFLAQPEGPTCHLGSESCFEFIESEKENLESVKNERSIFCIDGWFSVLSNLEKVLHARWNQFEKLNPPSEIASRKKNGESISYTLKLFSSGIERIAQKIGEEGVETALAAITGDQQKIADEVADLIYHILVLLKAKGMKWQNVLSSLKARMK